MLYVRDVFGLPLEEAKKVVVEADGTSIEAWTDEIGEVIDNLSTNLKDADDAGTPRMIIDQTGALANVKRHDYLPFGEEVSSLGLRATSLGYAASDSVRQQFTAKERDIETGLDYFGARYYGSSFGRFSGADPYDINIERQNIDDRDEGDRLLQEYLEQPQHWNRYTYALNNPLKFIDPDGLDPEQFDEYKRTLLGKDITIKISREFDEKQRSAILNQIDAAINKINDGIQEGLKEAYTLNSKEIEAVTSLNGLTVTDKIAWSHMDVKTGTFMITSAQVLNGENDGLVGSIVHDSLHKAQANHGKDYGGEKAEMQASDFALGVALKLQLNEQTIQNLCRDSKFGHKVSSNNPYKTPKQNK
jgi:RHS repeat-associated protein